ncbi:baseplate J/gp47 family protein [Defluviitalea saccharophila]|uniref:Baseplate J/gp47 family protein n=1 Tax=Defluviitalea saccharophila TaxID=879970 RepID=A0ABZ2Y705_9FIRM
MLLPKIDQRSKKDIIEQIKTLSQTYAPEWNFDPESDDVGSAFSVIFSKMYYELVERFNKIPYKNFIAFLNMTDTSLLPIVPAEGYISFRLSTGTKKGIYVPKNQSVFAVSNSTGERVTFETQGNLFLTPANIIDVFQVYPKEDEIRQLFKREEENIPKDLYFFYRDAAQNIQERILQIGAINTFYVSKEGEIELELDISSSQKDNFEIVEELADSKLFQWSLLTGNKSKELKNVSAKGRKLFFSMEENYYEGLPGKDEIHFLCCQSINSRNIQDILLRKIYIKAKNKNIIPDKIFSNDIEQPNENFYGFMERFSPYDTFYICSDEAFSKKNAYIELTLNYEYKKNNIEIEIPEKEVNWKLIMKKSDFREQKEYHIKIARVIWEYWDGNGWARLFINKEYEEIFYDENIEESYQKKLIFKCPENITRTFVNTHESFWIRARILDIENMFKTKGYYISPYIHDISISYDYRDDYKIPDELVVKENLETRTFDQEIKPLGEGISLFKKINVDAPAVYIGFDEPPTGVPIKVFFSVYRNEISEPSKLRWEYFSSQYYSGSASKEQWKPLTVFDETESFKHSGIVTIVGPEDFKLHSMFGKERYWIRIIDEEKKYSSAEELWEKPKIKAIYMNTVQIKQEETIEEEYFSIDVEEQNKVCELLNSRVMSAEVWVNEFGNLSDEELEEVKKNHALKFIRDDMGTVEEIWVKWNEVDNFAKSNPDSRHYILDSFEGKIYFGDGRMGKIPPSQNSESIMVKYCISQGSIGNFDSFEINTLGSSLAYIDEVFNPEPTFGGCDRETLEEALIRGPKRLRHLQRAVSNRDFEALVKEASRNISKVKCMSNVNALKEKEPGSITMVIMPEHYNSDNNQFNIIEKKVRDYLEEKLPSILELSDKFYIVETDYLEISTTLEIIAEDWADFYELEKTIQQRLRQFLNPIGGNYNKKGWDIGDIPTSTIIYNYIKVVEGVKAINKFSIKTALINKRGKQEIDFEHLTNKGFMTVVSGNHEIKICIL